MAKPPMKIVAQMARKISDLDRDVLARIVLVALGPRLELGGVAFEHHDDVVDRLADAAGKIAGPEGRNHRVLDDQPRVQIGQRALQPVAHLDPHLAVVARHQQQNAIVLARLAELPGAEQAIGIVFQRLAVERWDGGDDDLIG